MGNVALSPVIKDHGLKLTRHIDFMPRARIVELYLNSPILLYDLLLN
jgi:hypothetical protein